MNLSRIVVTKQVATGIDSLRNHYLNIFQVIIGPNDIIIDSQKYIIELVQKNIEFTDDLYVLEYHNDKYFIGIPFDKYVESYETEVNIYTKMLEDNISALEKIRDVVDEDSKNKFIKKLKKQLKKEKKKEKSYDVDSLIMKLKMEYE